MNLQLCVRCLPFSFRSALLGIPVSDEAKHLPVRGRILIMRSQRTLGSPGDILHQFVGL